METQTTHSLKLRRSLLAAMTLVALAAPLAPAIAREAVKPPAATEFGLGPRASANHLYTAVLEPREPIRLRKLQSVAVRIVDANGKPIEGAAISVDGGMPEHRHGLPTQPRVTQSLGDGVYEIEGVRFSMGGWWELKLGIQSPAGADTVTFNLSL
jgi:hypothetical protein